MPWSNGYVTDVPYTSGAFRDQSPNHLNFACLLNGFEPVPLDRGFNYIELGCGQGLTANIMAAGNPRGRFYAADFMPGHIAGAEDLARQAGLDNLTLLDKSFAELASGAVDLPKFHFITLHGVYAWISPETRSQVVKFIDRYLRPGGVVYVSYNAMPGWTSAVPLQRLLIEQADRMPGSSEAKVQHARSLVDRLIAVKSGYFSGGPDLQRRLDALVKESPTYLAHEYLNRCWQPLYHSDVARELAAAKLGYAGSSNFCHSYWRETMSPAQVALLDELPDDTLRETIKDYIFNTSFRTDVFVRGRRPLTPGRRQALLDGTGLALLVPSTKVGMGEKHDELSNRIKVAVLKLLDKGPCTLAELAALPALEGQPGMTPLVATLLTSCAEGAIFDAVNGSPDVAPAHRLNLAIARRALFGDDYRALSSPLLGNVFKVPRIARLVYLSLAEAPQERDAAAIGRKVWQSVQPRHADAGASAGADSPTAEAVAAAVREILEMDLPVWQQLKLL